MFRLIIDSTLWASRKPYCDGLKAWKEAITQVRGGWVSPPSVHPSIKIITTNMKIEIGIDTYIINIDFRDGDYSRGWMLNVPIIDEKG